MKNKTLAGVYIALAAMFLVACGTTEKSKPLSLLSVDYRLIETRYCGKTERDAKVAAAFRRQNPCPATGLTIGSCPDWQIDHVIPIDAGGCNAVSNMQWLPVWLKTCAGHCKDRFERKIYCKPVTDGGTGCTNSVIQPTKGHQ
jgi:hypothetical protein